jgi:hypothetical protein
MEEIMLNYAELEEIIDKFREELTLANRTSKEELENFLDKHNISLLKKENNFSYCDVRNSQILIIGQLNIKIKDINGICKSLGIEPERLVYVSYDEATNFPFDSLRYSNRYSDVIFGATPHMGCGIGNNSSIIAYLESNSTEFPNIIRACDSNGLNLNKNSLKNSLMKTRFYFEMAT